MEKPAHRPVEPPPIDAQLIEQAAPAATQSIQRKQPAAIHRSKPLPQVRPHQAPVIPHQAPVMPQVSPHIEQNPIVQKAEVTPNTATTAPAAAAPSEASAMPSEGQTTAAGNTSANSGAQAGSNDNKGSSHGSMYANSGARAIVHPKPQIPDDMREETFKFAPLARFHIAADGSFNVELVKPTPNPRLNRILLDSLKQWQWFPAIKNGKPVASTKDIVVKIEVR
jgi:protein TonB